MWKHFEKSVFLVLRLRDKAEKHVQAILRKSNLLEDDIQASQKNCEALRKGTFIFS